jgi:hypothetical protein
MGRLHQHRVIAAAPTPAPTTPRTPSPLSCVTRRVSTPRGVHGLPGGVQAPSAVEPRRRQGRIPPPPPQAHSVEHLGCPRKTIGGPRHTEGYTREWPRPIRSDPVRPATCFPATRRPPWNPATPAARDPVRLASHGPATARAAGIPAAPAIRGSREAGPVKREFLIYLNSRKIGIPFEKS